MRLHNSHFFAVTMSFRLTYFTIRARAEPIVNLLVDAGVSYEDIRVDLKTEWPSMKQDTPFNLLPTLQVPTNGGPVLLCETSAILGYLEDTLNEDSGFQARSALDKAKQNVIKESCYTFMSWIHDNLWVKVHQKTNAPSNLD